MDETWLVDTFAIIGYDLSLLPRSAFNSSGLAVDGHLSERPKILFRYPSLTSSGEAAEESSGQIDHVANIIDFCQPLGWSVFRSSRAPQFHMVVLTDCPGCRLYAAVLNLYEATPMPRDSSDDCVEEHSTGPAIAEGEEISTTDTASVKSWISGSGGAALQQSTPSKRAGLTALEIPVRRDSKASLRSGSSANQEIKAAAVSEPLTYIYIPKSLVIISKYNYPDVFKACLNTIYRVHLEQISRFPVETAIANLVASVLVPPPGYPPVSFGLGVGPRLTIRQPMYKTVPVTGSSVYQLFHYLGVHNTLTAVCCLLNEFKVVVHSASLNHLTQCCHALISLLYPLPYYHVYIPVLPESIIAMLSAPTPFLIGIHVALRQEALSQPDVVVIDVDAGSIRLPDSIRLLLLGEAHQSRITNDLMRVLNPELFVADNAFSSSNGSSLWSPPNPTTSTGEKSSSSSSAMLSSSTSCLTDKMLRACFLRLFATLFASYRHSLSAIRICPEPCIVFDKAHFLGQRGESFTPSECLLCSLLTSFFPQFLQERMLPFREADIFDDICSSISQTIAEEEANPERTIDNIRFLAHQLLQNEQIPHSGINHGLNSSVSDAENFATVLANIPKPYPALQMPDSAQVDRLVIDARNKIILAVSASPKPAEPPLCSKKRKVILGNAVTIDSAIPTSFLRRLEVVRSCIGHIFNNRIAEARRLLPATMRALKLVEVRRRLPAELSRYAFSDGEQQQIIIAPVLNNHQFDLVVQLVVFALSLESHWDENGIAAAMLPLSTIFYRYLGDSRHQQFLYTAIQEHPLWLNQAFWTSVIYRHIAAAVAAVHNSSKTANTAPNIIAEPPLSLECCARYLEQQCHETNNGEAQRQNGELNVTNGERVETTSREEESMAYSYCKHFANLMVYLLTPLDPSRDLSGLLNSGTGPGGDFAANSTHSHNNDGLGGADSSVYSESGFDEQDLRDVKGVVHWFISRVLQNVCTETGVSDDHRRNLESILGETVGSHMDYLEMVYQHTRHLPPLQKPRILEPTLLPGEQKLIGPLRAIILPDGRRLGINGDTWIGQAPGGTKSTSVTGPSGQRRIAQSGAASDITSVTVATAGDLDDAGSSDHAVCLLPAEGAIFLTTYRLVFIGNPIDAYASEVVISRSLPVTSLWSEKQVPAVYLHHPYEHYFTQCYQMRSNHFEIIKILFDSTEVNEAAIVDFRQQLSSLRWPVEVASLFCARQVMLTSSGQNATMVPESTLPTSTTITPLDGRKRHSKSKLKTLAKNTLSKLNVGANVQLSIERRITRTGALIQRQLFSNNTNSSSTIRASQRGSTLSQYQPATISESISFACLDRANMLMQDFERLKLGQLGGRQNAGSSSTLSTPNGSSNSGWRLSFANRQFAVCRSYPEVVSTLVGVPDEILKRIAQGCRMSRFPSAVWRHANNGAVLVRSAAFLSPTNRVITAIRRTANESTSANSGSKDETLPSSSTLASDLTAYVSSLVQIALVSSGNNEATLRSGHGAELIKQDSKSDSNTGTPVNIRRTNGSIPSMTQSSNNVGVCIVGDAAQLKMLRSVITDPAVDFISIQITAPTAVKAAYKRLVQKAVCLADAGERRKREMFNTNAQTGSSTFHVSGGSNITGQEGFSMMLSGEGFFKAFNDSGWLQQISTLLRVSSMIAMLIDAASVSVVVAAEDGSDFVTQVVALAQLLLDPFYRTRVGFKVLITREWLAFGHRFGTRGSQMAPNRNTSFVPMFIQFLDAVHQLVEQFPVAFEFNQFFVNALAYHSTSSRFFDWLLDCDADRLACGLPLVGSEDKNDQQCPFFWDFVEKQWESSPLYYNFLYDAERNNSLVLSPKYLLPYLRIWDYFYGNPLANDLTYDQFIPLNGNPSPRQITDSTSAIVRQDTSTQILVDAAFEAPDSVFCNGLVASLKTYCETLDTTGLLEDATSQQSSFHDISWHDAVKTGALRKGKPILDTQMSPIFHPRIPVPVSRQLFNWTLSQMPSSAVLELARSLGSLSLNELAISFGRGAGNQPHLLRPVPSVSKASICGACSAMLWPPTPAVVCERCPLVAHRQCQAKVSKMHQCPGQNVHNGASNNESPALGSSPASPPQVIMYRSDLIAPASTQPPSYHGRVAAGRSDSLMRPAGAASSTLPVNMPSTSRFMMSGPLFKRGQLLHGLTRRFYVLDLASQRIVYYESESEAEISGGVGAEKGAIPLTQIVEVVPLDPQQQSLNADSAQTADYGFTIVTTKRSHHFLTSHQKEADKWTEAIGKALTLL